MLYQLFSYLRKKEKVKQPDITKSKVTHKRSIIKALSWRAFATLDTMIIAYFITGQIIMAVEIGLIEVCTKIFIYYFHERLWEWIPFGKGTKS